MAKFVINPNTSYSREIDADNFRLENEYFWVFDTDSKVVSINKAQYIDRIDWIA